MSAEGSIHHRRPQLARLGDASPEEVNAAFDAIHPDLVNIVNQFVPGFWRGQALAKLQEPQTIKIIVGLIDDALNAAEKVRDAKPPSA